MRTSSTLAGFCCVSMLLLTTGCRHAAEARKPVTIEPVAVLSVTEQPGSPGVFVTTDGDSAAPARTTAAIPAPAASPRAESKPLRPMPARLPALTPDKPTPIPPLAPSEPLNPPIPPLSSKTPPMPAAPLFAPAMGLSPVVTPAAPVPADSTVTLDELTISVRTMPKPTTPVASTPALPKIINGGGSPATAGVLKSPIIPVGLGQLAAITPEEKPVVVAPVAAMQTPRPPAVAEIPLTRISHGRPAAAVKASHAADFRWLTGELSYSHSRKCWRVRFAGIETEEDYGGAVTLAGAERLVTSEMEGKTVRVEGEILDKFAATSPRYLVAKLTVLD